MEKTQLDSSGRSMIERGVIWRGTYGNIKTRVKLVQHFFNKVMPMSLMYACSAASNAHLIGHNANPLVETRLGIGSFICIRFYRRDFLIGQRQESSSVRIVFSIYVPLSSSDSSHGLRLPLYIACYALRESFPYWGAPFRSYRIRACPSIPSPLVWCV